MLTPETLPPHPDVPFHLLALRNARTRTTQYDSLELTQERIDSITDKIPQRPVGVVEGTSYTVIILAAFGVRGGSLEGGRLVPESKERVRSWSGSPPSREKGGTRGSYGAEGGGAEEGTSRGSGEMDGRWGEKGE